jgi:hypothetical protein
METLPRAGGRRSDSHPLRTVEAEARDCRAVDALSMLVNEGIIGIKCWTGVDVDAFVMRRTLEDRDRPSTTASDRAATPLHVSIV